MNTRERAELGRASRRLAELLDVQPADMGVQYQAPFAGQVVDALAECRGLTFVLELRGSGSLAHIFRATHLLRDIALHAPESTVPLLVVPFMGASAREHCREMGVSWLDLSGNARISAPGLYVHTDGHRNRSTRPGRPLTAFGAKGSRVARWLLMHPGEMVRQRALADSVGLNEGHVSRVVSKLDELGLVERDASGVRVAEPGRLLEAWRDEYRFDRHSVLKGHVSASGGESVAAKLAAGLAAMRVSYAATGLAGAWYWTRYAGYRLATVYLEELPSAESLTALGFRDESRGANTWLTVPNDDGVFDGAQTIDGVRCVHPVQVYLDLKDHPERSAEAAEELRRQLDWNIRERQTAND